MKFITDTQLIFSRNMTRVIRNPMWMFIALMQPILYLLLYAPLLDGLNIPGFNQSSSLDGFIPGLLVAIALFSLGFAGSAVLPDLQDGEIERMRVTPASRVALLLGMLLQEVLVFLIECAVLVVAATLLGMRADLTGLVILFPLLALIGVMIASFSYSIALIFKDQSILAAMISALTLPLLLLSGVLLPLSLAPDLMQTVAKFNPFAYAVDAARELIAGDMGNSDILTAYAIIFVMMTLAFYWSVSVFRKATA